jgi:hypothetical protein
MTWQLTTRSLAGAAASIAVATSQNSKYQTRLRAMYCTLAGASSGSGTVVVRDGASGTGTVMFEGTLSISVNSRDLINRTDLDIRATVGNVLTIEFLAGTAGDFQAINAQGDYIPPGIPYGATSLSE